MKRRHLGVAAVALGVSVVGGNLSNYAFQVLSGRALGPDEYGVLAALLSIMGMAGLASAALQTAGAREVATRGVAPAGKVLDTFARSALIAGIAVAALLTVLSPLIAPAFGISAITLLCLGAYLIPTVLLPVGFGKMQGAEDFIALAAVGLGLALMKVAIAAVAGLAGLGVTEIMASLVVATGLVAIVSLRMGARHGDITLRVTGPQTRLPLVAFILFWTLGFVDVALAPIRFAAGEAGQYAAAATLGRSVVWIPSLVALVVFPRLVANVHEGRDTRHILRVAVLISLVLSLLVVAFLVVFGTPLFSVLYGAKYPDAASLSWKLALAGIPLGLANLLLFEKLARHQARFLIPLTVILIGYVVALALVPPTGVAFTVVTAIADLIVLVALSGPLFREGEVAPPEELRLSLAAEFEHG